MPARLRAENADVSELTLPQAGWMYEVSMSSYEMRGARLA